MTSKAFFNAKKLVRMLSAIDYGLVSDGAADDGPVLVAMGAALGLVVVPSGNTRIKTNTTIIGLMVFEPGAYLTIDAGVTLNIEGLVHSPAQYIFRGLGTVLFGGDPATNTYSMARVAKSEWFGLKAGSGSAQDTYLAAALNSMGTTREGSVTMPMGTITLAVFPTVPRGVKLMGAGSRRTALSMPADGVAGFVTGGVACWFEGFQFDIAAGSYKNGGYLIDLQHQDCVVVDVGFAACTNGIRMAGSNCRVRNIINTAQPSVLQAGSCIVNIQAADSLVEDINVRGSGGQFLEKIVRIESPISGVSRITVRDVDTTVTGAQAVGIVGGSNGIADVTIRGIQQGGTNGIAVDITHAGSSSIHEILVSDIQVSPLATAGITANQSGSGSIHRLTIGEFSAGSGLATGISLTQSSGTFDNVRICDDCDTSGCTVGFVTSGVVDVRSSPLAQTIRRVPSQTFSQTIATDSVFVFDTKTQLFGSIVEVAVNNTEWGKYLMRAATTPTANPAPNNTPSANMANTTGALTGTTGTAGKFTVSTDATGKLYFENRLGVSALAQIVMNTGVQTSAL